MTIEITDLEDFKDKFAALMAANVNMISAGAPPSSSLVSKMIDEFLPQFYVTTPMPAIPNLAGFIVVNNMTGYIPGEFRGIFYESYDAAQSAITRWINGTGLGKVSAYSVREATYFG